MVVLFFVCRCEFDEDLKKQKNNREHKRSIYTFLEAINSEWQLYIMGQA